MPVSTSDLIAVMAPRLLPLRPGDLKALLPANLNATDQEVATALTALIGAGRIDRLTAFPQAAAHAIDLLVKPGSDRGWTYKLVPTSKV